MKNLLILIFLGVTTSLASQCGGTINLSSQTEVDNYVANYGCTNLPGGLRITGNDINNLDGLFGITSIGNSLIIENCPQLINILGLTNCNSIDVLIIDGNDLLSSIDIFGESHVSINGSLIIANNNLLSALPSFNNYSPTLSYSQINISNNSNLASIDGFNFVQENILLTIQNNNILNSINGFNSVLDYSFLKISSNPQLVSILGFAPMFHMDYSVYPGNINIEFNYSLEDISFITGWNYDPLVPIRIVENSVLSECSFVSLCSIGGSSDLYLSNNGCGCNSIAEITDLCNGTPYCSICSNSIDYTKLKDFYYGVGGDSWTNNTGWLENCDPCSGWFGVTCDGNGRVIELELVNNNLVGSLPTSLGDLTQLQLLNLANNHISGALPDVFSTLPNLAYLNLITNDLSGAIPNSIGSLTNLDILGLSFNNFSGTIPSSLGNLNSLTLLGLNGNNLSGNIPPSLGNLPNINQINLSDNQLSGQLPSSLGNLSSSLNSLIVNDNLLNGCFDQNLLNICSSGFDNFINTGNSFDTQWSDFCQTNPSNCQQVDVQYLLDLYTSTGGASWTNNTGWIDGAAGTNCDPCGLSCDNPWFGITCNSSGRVSGISLPNNNLNGILPNSIDQVTFLGVLDLSTNNLSGNIPSTLGNLDLQGLYLQNNHLSGSIPSNLNDPIELNLSNNMLTGSIPSSFGNSPGLDIIDLSFNNLCGCYYSSLDGLCDPTITNANISDGNNFNAPWEDFCNNPLVGACGGNFLSCTHPDYNGLLALYGDTNGLFSWNNDTGWLDNCDPCGECGNNTPWYGITCANNRVTEINLANNNLTGSLPSNLDQLTELEKLIINNNQIGGELPPTYQNLSNLTQFTAAYNNFTGGIPAEYCSFVHQVNFTFSHNQLSDCYDPALSCMCQIFSPNSKISNGNNFTAPFTDFCASGDGDCSDNCIDLDGVDDQLRAMGISSAPNFSLTAWFKAFTPSNGGSEDRILSFGPTERLEIGIEQGGSTDGELWLFDEQSGSAIALGAQVRDDTWHHVAIVRSGNSGEVFLDGTNIYTYTASTPAGGYGPNFEIGSWTGSSSALTEFYGQVDEVAIWNYAMSASDVLNLKSCELNGSEFGLAAFWDFNVGVSEGDNTQYNTIDIPDKSGNGHGLSTFNMNLMGPMSNLVTSTTGVYIDCSLCYSPPIAQCNASLNYVIDDNNPIVMVSAVDIDGGSSSVCGGSLTFSFDQAGTVTSLTYDCNAMLGSQSLDLWVTDSNGLQSSCSTSITLSKNLPQYEALEEFYTLSNGDNWTDNTGWLTNCDPCGIEVGNDPWFGLTCNIHGEISQIIMPNNNMVGTLPPTLCVFPALEKFNVNGDYDPNTSNLSGNIPDVSCLNLNTFAAGGNQLSGTIPIDFANMANLLQFFVLDNQLTGPLPPFNQTQTILQDIRVNNNNLSGSIPGTYGSLPNLITLGLNDNDLSGCYPQQLAGLCNNPNVNVTNGNISDGNPSLSDWDDFCSVNSNVCCPSTLTIDWTPIRSGTYRSSGDIIFISPTIPASSNIILSHGVPGMANLPSSLNNQGSLSIVANGCN